MAREHVHWQISVAGNNIEQNLAHHKSNTPSFPTETILNSNKESSATESELRAAPAGQKILLYEVAHSRAGDKGNDLNFSIIPHYGPDIRRLKLIVTPKWVKKVLSPLQNPSSFLDAYDLERRDEWVEEHVEVEIYEARGIQSLNVVVRNILDGGVNCSRRIDRHGKTISDLVLCQQVVLPP